MTRDEALTLYSGAVRGPLVAVLCSGGEQAADGFLHAGSVFFARVARSLVAGALFALTARYCGIQPRPSEEASLEVRPVYGARECLSHSQARLSVQCRGEARIPCFKCAVVIAAHGSPTRCTKRLARQCDVGHRFKLSHSASWY